MEKRSGITGPLVIGGIGGYLFVQLFPFVFKLLFGLVKLVVSTALFLLGIGSKLALPAAVFYVFRYLLAPKQQRLGSGEGWETFRTPRTRESSRRSFGQARGFAEQYDYPSIPVASHSSYNPAGLSGLRASDSTTDDLKVIEGIGPAISQLLQDNGIHTFRDLADADMARLDQILEDANLRRIADPGSWSEQARMAAAGDFDGLREYQNTLKAGRTR